MCIQDICIPVWLVWVTVAVFGTIAIVVVGALSNQTRPHEGPTTEAPPPADTKEDEEEEEVDPRPILAREKILYDVSNDINCYLVVTKVDKEESVVYGYFLVELPAGSKNIETNYDRENDQITVDYEPAEGDGIELFFEVAEPMNSELYEEYDEYKIDYAEAKATV
jgi:hypothetical protein